MRIKRPRTLAVRLTLWYGSVFILSAGLAFFSFYLLMTNILLERTDQELLSQARTLQAVFESRNLAAVKAVMIREAKAAGERKVFFRLLYIDGSAFSSTNLTSWKKIGVSRIAIRHLLEGDNRVLETVAEPESDQEVRVLYTVIGPGVILQLGQALEHSARFIDAFWNIFIGTMAGLMLLSALAGWFMARKALAGLAEVTRTAEQISGKELDQRVAVRNRGDEIDRLAFTFNRMLDRIRSLVTGIREMSDNIAHDLKSPVTRIRGLAEITLTTAETLDDYREMAAATIEECDRLLDMINTMLMISKAEAGVDILRPERMDLARLVRDAADLFGPMAEDQGVMLMCRTPERCEVNGDIRLIQRMTANLLDNAIKYTPAGGWVLAAVEGLQDRTPELVVEDSGVGIADSDLDHIFDRFYRCDPSRSESGAGLGLSLAKAVAEAHGGSIEVISEPGKGSTFSVVLLRNHDTLRSPAVGLEQYR